jgi:hypothetical protein
MVWKPEIPVAPSTSAFKSLRESKEGRLRKMPDWRRGNCDELMLQDGCEWQDERKVD